MQLLSNFWHANSTIVQIQPSQIKVTVNIPPLLKFALTNNVCNKWCFLTKKQSSKHDLNSFPKRFSTFHKLTFQDVL